MLEQCWLGVGKRSLVSGEMFTISFERASMNTPTLQKVKIASMTSRTPNDLGNVGICRANSSTPLGTDCSKLTKVYMVMLSR